MSMAQVVLRALRFSPVSTIPPMLRIPPHTLIIFLYISLYYRTRNSKQTPQNSVDKKNNWMSLFVFFISLLIAAQHVSGNHVPIIRSWRLRDVIALCWYVPWLQGGCQDFCILYFSSNSCSTCFGQPCAHHQELTCAWCYSLVLVCAMAAGRLSRLLYSLFLF